MKSFVIWVRCLTLPEEDSQCNNSGQWCLVSEPKTCSGTPGAQVTDNTWHLFFQFGKKWSYAGRNHSTVLVWMYLFIHIIHSERCSKKQQQPLHFPDLNWKYELNWSAVWCRVSCSLSCCIVLNMKAYPHTSQCMKSVIWRWAGIGWYYLNLFMFMHTYSTMKRHVILCAWMCVSGVMSEQGLIHVSPSSGPGPGHQTALHRAAMVGNSDAVAALIQGGCAVDLQDRVSGELYACQTQLQERSFMLIRLY